MSKWKTRSYFYVEYSKLYAKCLYAFFLDLMQRFRNANDKLTKIIEPRYGLLDHLLSGGVLSVDEFDEVRGVTPVGRTVAKLLQVLQTKQKLNLFESFLEALEATQQLHVVNFLRGNEGEYLLFIECTYLIGPFYLSGSLRQERRHHQRRWRCQSVVFVHQELRCHSRLAPDTW